MLKNMFTVYILSILYCNSSLFGFETVIDPTMESMRISSSNEIEDDSKQVVNDPKTNLMWQDDESAKSVTKNWQGAIEYCQNLNVNGYSNWRLPSLEELRTIVDKNNSPTIKSEFKNPASHHYWSSTPDADDSYRAWYIAFYYGGEGSYHKYNDYNVRCVRDSK